ncbi:MAG: hypothetical protein OEP95_06265 [Myxococcales bacterium]|nr:hypothetical protein [Myxococcales bacterium]
MDDPSVRRVGTIAAYGVALAYLLTGVTAVLMPPELQGRPDITPHEFWTVLSQHPIAHLSFHWAWVAAGVFGVAAVPAISLLVWPIHRGAVMWSGLGSWVGFVVMARSHLMELAWDRKIIPVYQTADPAFQDAVHVVAGLALDVPDGVLTYGAVGAWVAVVSTLALRREDLPRWFSYLGFLTAAALLAGVVGYGFLVHFLIVVSVGVGGFLLVPAWFVWAGLLLKRSC